MHKKYIILISVCVLIIIGVFSYSSIEYNLKKTQINTLYNYFHKIQDLIKLKHYPINMDSLKTAVYDGRNTISIYTNLNVLEDSVNAYKPK